MYALLYVFSLGGRFIRILHKIFLLFISINFKLAFKIKILRPDLPDISNPQLKQLFPIINLHMELIINFNSHRIILKVERFQQRLAILIHFGTD